MKRRAASSAEVLIKSDASRPSSSKSNSNIDIEAGRRDKRYDILKKFIESNFEVSGKGQGFSVTNHAWRTLPQRDGS